MTKKPLTLTEQLRRHMVQSGISQNRLAKATGVPVSTVNRFWNKTGGMSLQYIDAVAEYLDLELVERKRKKA